MQIPKLDKLTKSVLISIGAVGLVLILKSLFPDYDFTNLQSVVLTATSGVIVAMAREALK